MQELHYSQLYKLTNYFTITRKYLSQEQKCLLENLNLLIDIEMVFTDDHRDHSIMIDVDKITQLF